VGWDHPTQAGEQKKKRDEDSVSVIHKGPTDNIKKIILSDKKYPWARPPQKPTRVLVKVASCSSAEAPTEWFRYILLMGMDGLHCRSVLTPCQSRQIKRLSIKDILDHVNTALSLKTS
jgi:hypothetical protein